MKKSHKPTSKELSSTGRRLVRSTQCHSLLSAGLSGGRGRRTRVDTDMVHVMPHLDLEVACSHQEVHPLHQLRRRDEVGVKLEGGTIVVCRHGCSTSLYPEVAVLC